MRRAFKWLLPALIVVQVVLALLDVLPGRVALAGGIGLELTLLLVAGWQARAVMHRYRAQRGGVEDRWRAFEDALGELLPVAAARVLVLELRLWACLGTWLSRRPRRDVPAFAYHRRSTVGALIVVVLLSAPVEALLLHVLIPWDWLRWTLLALEIYGIIWMLGYYASLRVLPHQVEPRGARLRYGALGEVWVPFDALGEVILARAKPPKDREGLRVDIASGIGWLVVGGRTDVTLHFVAPVTARRAFGGDTALMTLHVAVDDPEAFHAALAERTVAGVALVAD